MLEMADWKFWENKGGQAKHKTTINFISVEEKKERWSLAVPAMLLILAVAVLFSKFAVVDRYTRLFRAQAQVAALQHELDAGLQRIDDTRGLAKRYNHYTWSGMSDEERNRQSRVAVAELVATIRTQTVSVNSFTVSGDQVSVNITAPALESISRLSLELERQPIVESCSMPTAQTSRAGQEVSGGVNADITIYLKPRSETVEDEGVLR